MCKPAYELTTRVVAIEVKSHRSILSDKVLSSTEASADREFIYVVGADNYVYHLVKKPQKDSFTCEKKSDYTHHSLDEVISDNWSQCQI